MTLDEARRAIGRHVVYTIKRTFWSENGTKHEDVLDRQDGVIIRVNDRYVFVRYTGDLDGAKATRADDLELA